MGAVKQSQGKTGLWEEMRLSADFRFWHVEFERPEGPPE